MTATLLRADLDQQRSFSPRRVRFDYGDTPMHWVPDDPHTTHVANVLHLLLPAGERWFCEVYRAALPRITDERLRRDVKAFIGQEATHARAHTAVLDHLRANGVDARPYTRIVEGGFRLAKPRRAPKVLPARLRTALEQRYLLDQLAVVAAIEHFTAALGWWIVASRGLDDAGADPEMMALLRWHGAEEVEHRSVAFDVYVALGGGPVRRALAMGVVLSGMISLWFAGTEFLLRRDRSAGAMHASVRRFVRAGHLGRLPLAMDILRALPRYLSPRYHPSHEGRTEVAVAYLASAPGPTS